MSAWKENQLIPLRERDNQEYQPSEEEILDYAQHIGLEQDDVLNEQLLMLAYEGIKAKLPAGWEACSTPDEDIVYRNIKTRQVFQEHPLDSVYREKVKQLKKMLSAESQSQENSMIREELSQIQEEDNELRNESDIYERERYHPPPASRDLLRKSINQQDFRSLIQAENYQNQNSALNRKISSKDIGNPWLGPSQKLLPSSLLKELPSLPLQGGLQQEKTVITQVDRAFSRDHSGASSFVEKKEQQKRIQLLELQKQLALKSALLEQIRESNALKTAKLKKRLRKR